MRGVVLDAVPPLELRPRLLQERRVAADGEEFLHLVVEELVVFAAAAACVGIVNAAVDAARTRDDPPSKKNASPPSSSTSSASYVVAARRSAGDVAGCWPRTAPRAARADKAALRPGAVRADTGGVRSASAVVIVDVRSRSNSASRPSTRDFFRRSTSFAISSMRLVSAWMASRSSSFVADSRRRRRVQLCVAVLCSGRRRGAKLWATASSAMHSVLCIVPAGAFDRCRAGWPVMALCSSLASLRQSCGRLKSRC